MHDHFVLLKRRRELDDKSALLLDGWTQNFPLLAEAYRLKEEFFGIYDAHHGMRHSCATMLGAKAFLQNCVSISSLF